LVSNKKLPADAKAGMEMKRVWARYAVVLWLFWTIAFVSSLPNEAAEAAPVEGHTATKTQGEGGDEIGSHVNREDTKGAGEALPTPSGRADEAKEKGSGREPTLMDSYSEMFNYASLECGAKLLASNEDAQVRPPPCTTALSRSLPIHASYLLLSLRCRQGASNVLSESKERYAMSPCGSERWLVIELCEEVGLTAFEVANFEFFSSTFKVTTTIH
jgi:hypothetical protein